MPGLVIVAGGKYTTYRVMAEDAVDEAVKMLPGGAPKSVTDKTPLIGADGYRALVNNKAKIAADSGLSVDRVDHLLGRYGSAITEMLAMIERATRSWASRCRRRRSTSRPSSSTRSRTRARCTWTTSWPAGPGSRSTPGTAGSTRPRRSPQLVAPLLDWDDAAVIDEVEHYRARVAAERDSQVQPDDRTADAARLGAPDVRVGASAGSRR